MIYSSKLLSRHAWGLKQCTFANISFAADITRPRSPQVNIFIVRLPHVRSIFLDTSSTSRHNWALWYWSSSLRHVVLGATSLVITSYLAQLCRYVSSWFWIPSSVISPWRVNRFVCGNFWTSCRSTPITCPWWPTNFPMTCIQLPGAQPRSSTVSHERMREYFSCISKSLNALRAR